MLISQWTEEQKKDVFNQLAAPKLSRIANTTAKLTLKEAWTDDPASALLLSIYCLYREAAFSQRQITIKSFIESLRDQRLADISSVECRIIKKLAKQDKDLAPSGLQKPIFYLTTADAPDLLNRINRALSYQNKSLIVLTRLASRGNDCAFSVLKARGQWQNPVKSGIANDLKMRRELEQITRELNDLKSRQQQYLEVDAQQLSYLESWKQQIELFIKQQQQLQPIGTQLQSIGTQAEVVANQQTMDAVMARLITSKVPNYPAAQKKLEGLSVSRLDLELQAAKKLNLAYLAAQQRQYPLAKQYYEQTFKLLAQANDSMSFWQRLRITRVKIHCQIHLGKFVAQNSTTCEPKTNAVFKLYRFSTPYSKLSLLVSTLLITASCLSIAALFAVSHGVFAAGLSTLGLGLLAAPTLSLALATTLGLLGFLLLGLELYNPDFIKTECIAPLTAWFKQGQYMGWKNYALNGLSSLRTKRQSLIATLVEKISPSDGNDLASSGQPPAPPTPSQTPVVPLPPPQTAVLPTATELPTSTADNTQNGQANSTAAVKPDDQSIPVVAAGLQRVAAPQSSMHSSSSSATSTDPSSSTDKELASDINESKTIACSPTASSPRSPSRYPSSPRTWSLPTATELPTSTADNTQNGQANSTAAVKPDDQSIPLVAAGLQSVAAPQSLMHCSSSSATSTDPSSSTASPPKNKPKPQPGSKFPLLKKCSNQVLGSTTESATPPPTTPRSAPAAAEYQSSSITN